MELERVSRMQEATLLRSYLFTIQGVAGVSNPVESFLQITTEPLVLRTDKFSWYSMQGMFIVRLKLNSTLPDPSRYDTDRKLRAVRGANAVNGPDQRGPPNHMLSGFRKVTAFKFHRRACSAKACT